ncbi:MAG: hypothetical protein A2749_03020 [Parcubacteria group bacterium RIFCSPHIGHO2_01_FULL_45_26]|nr:MAG: hypothetical protein A2749_03020 [Parcubacteria group bacterium RIFCSPHIGHO2_01_FULL_45_26]
MSSNTNNEIKSKVMRRVYIVSYIRRALSPMALKLYAVVFLLWGIGRQVFVAKVIENAPSFSSPLADLHFFTNAFLGTEFLVQILVLGCAMAVLCFATDLVFRRQSALVASF